MRRRRIAFIAAIAVGLAAAPTTWAQAIRTNVIFGSSVAKGYLADGFFTGSYINGSVSNSYAAFLTQSLATDGWYVVNESVVGDQTTGAIARFNSDVPVGVDEVFIAYSLFNEGLAGSPNPQAVYNQFFSGITNLIAMTRQNGSLPLLGCVYPYNGFSSNEYIFVKNMVLQLNTLNVPYANFLGVTDDGQGHWVNSLSAGDGIHPNDAGQYEMFLAIVPSVFDAVKAGLPSPSWGNSSRFARIPGDPGQPAPLSFNPGSTVHSFSMSFRVRTTATGTVASVTVPGSSMTPTIEITPTGLVYMATNGQMVNSGVIATDGAWHAVVLTHQYARGQTWLYVDGALAGTVYEQPIPIGFVLGGNGSAATRPGSPLQADYQNWFVHRSMLDAEEVLAQYQGTLQQESLEVYAPLDDPSFPQGGSATNRAQSFSVATINGAVLPPAVAGFTASPTTGQAPFAVSFADGSSGAITNWFWDFGDGTTSNTDMTTIQHTYSAVGTDTVTLIVSGPSGVSTSTQPDYIVVNPSPGGGLAITKNASPNPVLTSQMLTYTLVITNLSADTAPGVTVTDTLPGSVVFSSAALSQGTCTNIGGVLSCSLGDLPAGAGATITIVGAPTASNNIVCITNTATVSDNEPAAALSNNTASVATTVYLDTIGDGIPDWWRQQYFSSGASTDQSSCASCDPDGDGMSNLQEYLAGTDPTNNASAFRVISLVRTNADICITWTLGGGRSVVVEAAPNLSGSYLSVGPDIFVVGTGDTVTNVLDAGAATNTSRYYRARLVP